MAVSSFCLSEISLPSHPLCLSLHVKATNWTSGALGWDSFIYVDWNIYHCALSLQKIIADLQNIDKNGKFFLFFEHLCFLRQKENSQNMCEAVKLICFGELCNRCLIWNYIVRAKRYFWTSLEVFIIEYDEGPSFFWSIISSFLYLINLFVLYSFVPKV